MTESDDVIARTRAIVHRCFMKQGHPSLHPSRETLSRETRVVTMLSRVTSVVTYLVTRRRDDPDNESSTRLVPLTFSENVKVKVCMLLSVHIHMILYSNAIFIAMEKSSMGTL